MYGQLLQLFSQVIVQSNVNEEREVALVQRVNTFFTLKCTKLDNILVT